MSTTDVDQATLTELNTIIEARGLSAADERRLVSYVAGAVRPNRDKPVWDLCQIVSGVARALAAQGEGDANAIGETCIGLALDPSLTTPNRVKSRIYESVDEAASQEALAAVRWSEAPALLAFAEFLFVHDDCVFFADMSGLLQEICEGAVAGEPGPAVDAAVSRIASQLHAFRGERFPLAQYEKIFRAILSYLGERGDPSLGYAFDDEDIVAFWDREVDDGNRLMFRTVVQHFRTFEAVSGDMRSQRAFNEAASLDDAEAGMRAAAERISSEEVLDGSAAEDTYDRLTAFLRNRLPESVKVLTGAERTRLIDLLSCGNFCETRPLTVLRYISFGAVQSGISNLLRRGGGGAPLAERVTCSDAPTYENVSETYKKLSGHCERLLLIFTYLSQRTRDDGEASGQDLDDRLEEIIKRGQTALKQLNRAGFDSEPVELAEQVLPISSDVVALRDAIAVFLDRVAALERTGPLTVVFEQDQTRFANTLTIAYAAQPA